MKAIKKIAIESLLCFPAKAKNTNVVEAIVSFDVFILFIDFGNKQNKKNRRFSSKKIPSLK